MKTNRKEYICTGRTMLSVDGDHDTIYGSVIGELVRCRECIRWRQSKSDTTVMVCDWDGYERTENDYCSWAKRKDNDTR